MTLFLGILPINFVKFYAKYVIYMLIKVNKSPNFSIKPRPKKNVRFLIIHYTGMQSTRASLNRLKNPRSKVSSHYFIDRNGDTIKMVDENKIAWHAGKSKWKEFNNLNKYSIGIEIQNKGHRINYQNFPKKQIFSLIKLIKKLLKKYKIKKENVLGHSDIAPLRKKDPGEKFPWKKLHKNNIGIWYKKSKIKSEEFEDRKLKQLFFKNLFKIGYRYFSKTRRTKNDIFLIKAFQRRFLLNNITGKIDQKTFKISHFLANQTKN